jgi:hypothetical protein
MALTNGCTLGGFTFSDFGYTFPGGVPTADQITLSSVDTFTDAPDGFDFTANPSWLHQGMGPAYYAISYVVWGNTSLINAAAISAGGALENGGMYEWDENLCLDGAFDAGGTCFFGNYDLIQNISNQVPNSETTRFDGVSFIDVYTQLTLSGPQGNSEEATSQLEEQFALVPTPEPASIVLVMTALAAAPSLLKRYRLHRN